MQKILLLGLLLVSKRHCLLFLHGVFLVLLFLDRFWV